MIIEEEHADLAGRRCVLRRHPVCVVHLRLSPLDRKSTRLNSSHVEISYAVFCLKKKSGRGCAFAIEKNGGTAHQGAMDAPLQCSPHIWTVVIFFLNDTATPEIYPLSLHDALPI